MRYTPAILICVATLLLGSVETKACDTSPIAVISPGGDALGNLYIPPGDFTLDGSGSYDLDDDDADADGEDIESYSWDYGMSTDASYTQHYYASGSPYTVSLEVTDDEEDTGTDTVTVWVVTVWSVTPDKTAACVGESITFTAGANPSGKPLADIEWQSRYKSDDFWLPWTSAAGGDNTAVLNTGNPGYYQYRARNGEDDTWKESGEVVIVQVSGMSVIQPAGVNNTIEGSVMGFISPPDRTITWSIAGDDLGCTIAEDGTNNLARIAPATTGGTITVRATDSELDSCYDEITLDVVKISNMTFSPSAIATVSLEPSETTAAVTVVPSGRTISWEILPDDLGCDTFPATSTTADILAGTEGGTVTVRAKDSEIEDCYLDDSLTVINIELTESPGVDDFCLIYTGTHPESGEPLHGTEPTLSFGIEVTLSGGDIQWVADDEIGIGMFEIVGASTSATVDFRGATASYSPGDAWMDVDYTFEGVTISDSYSFTVSKPTSTTCKEDDVRYVGIQRLRDFYHKIEDQFGDVILTPGIVCDEDITVIYGEEPDITGPGTTQDYGGNWGIAVKDMVSFPVGTADTKHDQLIIAGGEDTSSYYIFHEEATADLIWKELQ